MEQQGIKIAVFGGGSSYTPELIEGLLARRASIPLRELALVDIEAGRDKVETIAALTRRMLDQNGLQAVKVSVHYAPDEAIRGAQFVLTQLRVGRLAARAADERLGLKYGLIGQETTGVGGFAKALRTIPVLLDIARRVDALAPDAWIINFTNPAAIVTEAVQRHTRAKIIGLCNVPVAMHHMIAGMMEEPEEDVRLRFAGLNHMVWVHEVYVRGENRTQQVLEMLCNGAVMTMNNIQEMPWPAPLLRALGAIPCPYHRYFYLSREMLREEQEAARAQGTRAEQVMKVEEELFALYRDPALNRKPEQLSFRGGAFYSKVALELIDAIYNDRGAELVVNTANRGAIQGLPDDAVIETNCLVNGAGAHPLTFGALPASMHALTTQIKTYERLTIQAAVEGDTDAGLLALVTNPLVGDAPTASALLDEVLTLNRDYLPQFNR